MNNYHFFASTYGSNAYNTTTYNGSASTGSTSGNSAGGSALTDTGIALAAVVTLACLIALVAVAVRVWRRPAGRLVKAEVTTATDNETE